MRSFSDGEGALWDVITGKASWGTQVLLFAPRTGGETRQTVLAVETVMEANQVLDAATDEELRVLLAESAPWG